MNERTIILRTTRARENDNAKTTRARENDNSARITRARENEDIARLIINVCERDARDGNAGRGV